MQLAEAFQLSSNNNLHLRDLIVDAMRAAADGEADTSHFREQVKHLTRITANLAANDGIRVVVDGLSKAADSATGKINAAG